MTADSSCGFQLEGSGVGGSGGGIVEGEFPEKRGQNPLLLEIEGETL